MSITHIAFYPSDWLSGTRGMSAEETGVYITLIARMYEAAGPIERDDARLSRLCGTKSKPSFVRCLEYLIAEGKITVTPEGLFNEKAQKVLQKTFEISSKSRAAAEARWNRKSNENNEGGDADAMRTHMPETCQPDPDPDPEVKDRDAKASLVKENAKQAVLIFNEIAERVGWPQVQKLTQDRTVSVTGRLTDLGGLEGWRDFLEKAASAPHLRGENDRGWTASFDFLTGPKNMTKVIEGNYDRRKPKGQTNGRQETGSEWAQRIARMAGGESSDPSQPLLPTGPAPGSQ